MDTAGRAAGSVTDQQDRSTRATRSIERALSWLGSFPAIVVSLLVVAAWAVGAGFVHGGFGNSAYELLLTAGTAGITFLMGFIIQNTQNRDARAIQTKLDAQSQALEALARRLDLDTGEIPRLLEVVGVEDAPESEIKHEQRRVRGRTPAARPVRAHRRA